MIVHGNKHTHPDAYDAAQDCLGRIQRGEIVYIIGGSGIIRVDPTTGVVVDGANLVGITRVEIPDPNEDEHSREVSSEQAGID